MIAGMRAQSVMHQEFVARIEEAEELAARCTNEKDRGGLAQGRRQLPQAAGPPGTASGTG
jgi:hypothetical protein